MTTFRPVTPATLIDLVADRAAAAPGVRLVAISGADATDPVGFAGRTAAHLRLSGRPAAVVALHDYVRPASLRLEHGHRDDDSYRTGWFDYPALKREVVTALRERRQWLPRLWDESTDRSARASVLEAGPGQVLLIAGPMLHGRELGTDVVVRLMLSRSALERRTPSADRWTIDALLTHDAAHDAAADIVVRYDHPDRPAVSDGP
ncbi:hypothetical protein EGT67_05220 [Prescottella agglutinans]|uniref:Uridine kinase n=1 Tax=Prescottella agglutinans TaxID=1644129 RepID=A0A3S3AKP2_9NOCA|nr:hypothetical protein [Prescottella agglutinans]RVW10566.1 hypothetical protein EGT67_05220 [Prescottella agglutinans]